MIMKEEKTLPFQPNYYTTNIKLITATNLHAWMVKITFQHELIKYSKNKVKRSPELHFPFKIFKWNSEKVRW